MLAESYRESLSTDGEATGSKSLGKFGSSFLSFSNLGSFLGSVELNMAIRREIRSDTTVGTVSSSATLLSTLDGNVRNDALVDIETFGFTVSLKVVEEESDSLDRLFRPSTSVGTNLFALGVSLAEVLCEADNSFVLKDLFEVVEGLLNFHATDGVGGVESVLVVDALVLNLGQSGLGLLSGLSRVLNHCKSLPIY